MGCEMSKTYYSFVAILGMCLATYGALADSAGDIGSALKWRLVGPFRGGWSTMAVGVPTETDTYYSAAAGGGLWKTDDSGRTWLPLTDSLPITGVGAVAVAPSDGRIVYLGSGQPEPRYDVVAGSGVYRSMDSGKTWTSLGLVETRHIGAIVVDPRDANVVLVAALGHLFGSHPERGVYRTDDGGKTWAKTLYVNEATGAVDLAIDSADPNIVFASTWTARTWPWLDYFMRVEGSGSAIYKSTDGGRHWQKLGGEGWPQGNLGRIGIAVTHAHGATRLYATVDSASSAGLYRSDDAGKHWQKMNSVPWVASWYMSRITVSPTDPDTLYTAGRSVHESNDGGKTFTIVRGAPGGDDFHYYWINPQDLNRRVAAADQGTIVTTNGGRTWSDWYNQPTGQFYYLATDQRFPYWIYSGQTDNGTAALASRSDYGSLSLRDWHPVGGDERGYNVPDPEDPEVVFASGLGGRISRWDGRTGEITNVAPWPVASYAKRPTDYRYHYNWFTPITFSRTGPHVLYAGAQVLFKSLDRGAHWQTISSDLSGHMAGAKNCGGNPEPARAYACGFGTINVIAPSGQDAKEIWIGTDDGIVWLTRSGGNQWQKITPPAVPRWSKIASIDLVKDHPGVAYLAVDNHRQDDTRPLIYKTADYGRSWVQIARDLPQGHYVSVVRADPLRAGLLFAGTDRGVSVSVDDGQHWRSLSLNMPAVWVHDLLIHDHDVIIATVGRGIWVLDDIAPLRQWDLSNVEKAILYRPSPTIRLRVNQNKDTPFTPETPLGQNPPTGAVIDYFLAETSATGVELEVHDAAGTLIQSFSSAPPDDALESSPYFTADWLEQPQVLSSAAGNHRFIWNLRMRRPLAIEYQYSNTASRTEGAALTPEGPLVLPGEYRLTLRVAGKSMEQPLTILPDPRVTASASDMEASEHFAEELSQDLKRIWRAYAEVGTIRIQLTDNLPMVKVKHATGLMRQLEEFDRALLELVRTEGEESGSLAANGEILANLETDIEGSDRRPTEAQRQVRAAANARADETIYRWQRLQSERLVAVNRQLIEVHLPPLTVPDAAHLRSVAAPEGVDVP